jgi:hypothetical protein
MANYYVVGLRAHVNLYLVADDAEQAREYAERLATAHATMVIESVVPEFPVLALCNVHETPLGADLLDPDTHLPHDGPDIEAYLAGLEKVR